MKLCEVINSFEEPKLTPEEEIAYLRRRLQVLNDKSQKILDAAYQYQVETFGVRMYCRGDEQNPNNTVITIPFTERTGDSIYTIRDDMVDDLAKWSIINNYFQQCRQQALQVKQQYQKAFSRLKNLLKIPGIRNPTKGD